MEKAEVFAQATYQTHICYRFLPAGVPCLDHEGETEPSQARHYLIDDRLIRVADAQGAVTVAATLRIKDAGKESLAPLGGRRIGP
jgi:hypothetical protein